MKQYRLGDLLWWFKQKDVMNEIGTIMGVDYVDTNTPGWFKHQMAASQNLLNNMLDKAKEELGRKGEELGEKGMPVELQRKCKL